jgi:uncharacterized membrane protein
LPPQPPWEGLHPLVIHFPIALLFVTPVFVLLAALLGKYGRWFGLVALMLLVMGTLSGSVAVSSGDAAFDVLEDVEDGGWEVVEEHQQAAKNVQTMFIGLTILYAILFAIPLVISKLNIWKYWFPANLVFLALLMVVNLQLAHAAHLGGRLVHQYGARAVLGEGETAEVGTSEPEAVEFDDDTFDDLMSELMGEESDESADAATDDATDELTDESTDQPMDESTDATDDATDDPTEEPTGDATDQPMDESADQPTEPAEPPADSADEPEQPADDPSQPGDDAGQPESDDP